MSSRRRTEFEIEQTIFLGGQVSNKHDLFQTLAMLSPRFAIPYMMMQKRKELEQKQGMERTEKILYYLGIAENMPNYTELTRLSMILGDTRKRYDLGGIKDKLPTP